MMVNADVDGYVPKP